MKEKYETTNTKKQMNWLRRIRCWFLGYHKEKVVTDGDQRLVYCGRCLQLIRGTKLRFKMENGELTCKILEDYDR